MYDYEVCFHHHYSNPFKRLQKQRVLSVIRRKDTNRIKRQSDDPDAGYVVSGW